MLLRRLVLSSAFSPSAAAAAAKAAINAPALRLGRYRTLSQSSQQQPAVEDPAQYCLHLVKTHDYEAYLCGLLVPTTAR